VIFSETELAGAYTIDIERHEDARGFFARSFCVEEFAEYGLTTHWVQSNVSFNEHQATMRGMHWQSPPHEEVKLVRCTQGSIFDVIVDVRAGSATTGRWVGVELSAQNRRMLYIPGGFAHGFLTTADKTEVFYEMSSPHVPDAARGFCWNDPQLDIAWPGPVNVISDRDAGYPHLDLALIETETQ
jgi:dTDP-4-dehydrorhamnose 3,5-epimerase